MFMPVVVSRRRIRSRCLQSSFRQFTVSFYSVAGLEATSYFWFSKTHRHKELLTLICSIDIAFYSSDQHTSKMAWQNLFSTHPAPLQDCGEAIRLYYSFVVVEAPIVIDLG